MIRAARVLALALLTLVAWPHVGGANIQICSATGLHVRGVNETGGSQQIPNSCAFSMLSASVNNATTPIKLLLESWIGIIPNGTTVSSWVDQSGLANSVTQGTVGRQPTFVASKATYGGQPMLQFAGGQELCGTLAGGQAQPFTAYVVWESDNASNVVAL